MAESVFAMRLVNLQSVTCYTDQNFNENAHFGALNLFTSEKRLKLSYKTSINLEDPIILTSFFVIYSVFPKTNERKIEATPNQTQCPVFKRLQRHIGE